MYSDSTLRRRAHAQGLRLVKFSERSRWYPQYGPYALADAYRTLIAWGMDADQVARELADV